MAWVMVVFVFGIGLGFLLRRREGFARWVGRITDAVVFCFLFILGVSMGSSQAVIQNLSSLGLGAAALAVSAIAGSVLVAYPVYHWFFREEK
jgi:uncharacterized membrane protein YbjE (DUF340 family)